MARDVYHDNVREALEKDGWTITADPFVVSFGNTAAEIDLAAEQLIEATREGEKIAVEVKSFLQSQLSAFHTALGQFLNYRLALDEQFPERTLYLAIPIETHRVFFSQPIVQKAVDLHSVNLVIYETETNSIVQWIPVKNTDR